MLNQLLQRPQMLWPRMPAKPLTAQSSWDRYGLAAPLCAQR